MRLPNATLTDGLRRWIETRAGDDGRPLRATQTGDAIEVTTPDGDDVTENECIEVIALVAANDAESLT